MSLTAIGLALGASASTAAATGATIVGSLIAGVGSALMTKAELDAERKMKEEEEERAEARYEGVGDAVRFWDDIPPEDANLPSTSLRQTAHKDPNEPLGGLQVGVPETTKAKTATPQSKYRYNPKTGKVELT